MRPIELLNELYSATRLAPLSANDHELLAKHAKAIADVLLEIEKPKAPTSLEELAAVHEVKPEQGA